MSTLPYTPAGLSQQQAAQLLATVGPNALPPERRPPFSSRLLRQLRSALIYLLLVALALDLGTWLYGGAEHVPVEALAILAIILLNAGLGVLQEYRSERALDQLEKLGSPRVWVKRDGALERVEATALVPGDLVRLEAGDRVPADGTAVAPESLCVDESMLTGESVPLDKVSGDGLASGTLVTRGRAELLITLTGPASTMGRLAAALSRIDVKKTPLEQTIDALGARLARYVGVLSVVLVAAGLATQGLAHFPAVVMFAVAFAVAVVPESMPAMMTLALAFGVQRMARRNVVIRRLSAVEALGSVTVIASDKTGTLTSNAIVVSSLESPNEDEALLALVLANDAHETSAAGDPLEHGLVEFATSRGADVAALRNAYPRVSSRPFDTRWKYMRATVVVPGGERRSYVKGAIEVVLERSALDAESRAAWLRRAEEGARGGFKVLGLATGLGDGEVELDFLGLVMLWDPPRPEALTSVRTAQAAGITVLMITGDHPETARAIAERVGIDAERVLTGAELERLSPAELSSALDDVRVLARMLPEHKLRIVQALQARGEVVAMTGDGLNDAPALKQADIGVAMGKRGSEVAREVADVVLLDDDFSTIIAAIEEGRAIYGNIMNFIRFTFSSNVALMILVLGGAVGSALVGLRAPDRSVLLPLTALQVLWINFLGDGPPALALSMDRIPGVMADRPRARHAALLDPRTLRFILLDGGFKGAVGLGLLVGLPMLGVGLAATATAVFLYESVAKLLSAYPARKVGAQPKTNPGLHLSIAFGLVALFLCLVVGPLQRVLGLVSLDPRSFWPLVGAVLVTGASGELLAHGLRRRQESRPSPASRA